MDAHAQSAASRPRRSARTGVLLAALTAITLFLALLPGQALADTRGLPGSQATAAQADPSPSGDPAPPAESAPADPAPTEPAPSDPPPTDEAPVDPAPIDALIDPAPVDPAPAEPAPVEPAPTEPPPADPPPTPVDPMPLPDDPLPDDPIEPVEREVVRAPAKIEPAPSRPSPEGADALLPATTTVVVPTAASDAEESKTRARGTQPAHPSAETLEHLGIPSLAPVAAATDTVAGATLQACSASISVGPNATSETTSELAEHPAEDGEQAEDADPHQVRGPPAPFDGPTSPVTAGAAAAAGASGQGSTPDCALESDALVLELSDDPVAELPSFADHIAPEATHVAARAPPVA